MWEDVQEDIIVSDDTLFQAVTEKLIASKIVRFETAQRNQQDEYHSDQ